MNGRDIIKLEFMIRLADKVIRLNSPWKSLENYCSAYRTEGETADFSVFLTVEDIRAEQRGFGGEKCSVNYLETLAALRKIAEQLPFYDRFLMHGAAVFYDEKVYIFTAPSGTGKSTHIALWRRYLGETADVINGDKPVVSVEDGIVRVHGSPWAGKENWHKNRSGVLGGICFLQRAERNTIRRMGTEECLDMLVRQVYLPSQEAAAGRMLDMLDQIMKNVPVFLLTCDRSEDAFKCSFEGLTGLDYHPSKQRKM